MQITNQKIRTVAIAVLMPIFASCATKSTLQTDGTIGWDSSELQTQIDKKKLIMRVYYVYLKKSNNWCQWAIVYTLRAEDKNISGWHSVKELYSFTFNAAIDIPGWGGRTLNTSIPLGGESWIMEDLLFNEASPSCPNFISITATGSRYGGPSGISRTWP
jgi:hypothetical protein